MSKFKEVFEFVVENVWLVLSVVLLITVLVVAF